MGIVVANDSASRLPREEPPVARCTGGWTSPFACTDSTTELDPERGPRPTSNRGMTACERNARISLRAYGCATLLIQPHWIPPPVQIVTFWGPFSLASQTSPFQLCC